MKRRKFIQTSIITGISAITSKYIFPLNTNNRNIIINPLDVKPIVVATWNVKKSTQAAWETISSGGSALDAVEAGCMVEEANENGKSVGLGGLPDRDGNVTLDACIMDNNGDCGSVVYVKNIKHVVSLAKKVMQETPHVMLAGKGAEQFAYKMGFEKEKLLTESSKKDWENWKVKSEYKPIINIENHDTIGMLAIDKNGDISGACTTSGLAYKMNGRVGDSPIIGSGLFVDNEIGGAVATGLGEEVIKTVGSFLIVELMRHGKTPQEACKEAIRRIVEKPNSNYKNFQVGFIAINKKGEMGSYSIHENFSVTTYQENKNISKKSEFYFKK